jgi:hypothetical protein
VLVDLLRSIEEQERQMVLDVLLRAFRERQAAE